MYLSLVTCTAVRVSPDAWGLCLEGARGLTSKNVLAAEILHLNSSIA